MKFFIILLKIELFIIQFDKKNVNFINFIHFIFFISIDWRIIIDLKIIDKIFYNVNKNFYNFISEFLFIFKKNSLNYHISLLISSIIFNEKIKIYDFEIAKYVISLII